MQLLEQIVVLLPWCSSICVSVWNGVHCDHVVQVTADLSVWLDSTNYSILGTLKPKCVHLLPAIFFQFHLEERSGMDVQLPVFQEQLKIEVMLLLSANMKSHMGVDWHNNRWPSAAASSTSHAVSVVAELLASNVLWEQQNTSGLRKCTTKGSTYCIQNCSNLLTLLLYFVTVHKVIRYHYISISCRNYLSWLVE